MSEQPQRILVIRRRYMGDIVLLGIFLRNLRLHWPNCKLHVLVEENYAGVLPLNPDVSGVHLLPRKASALRPLISLGRELRRAGFTHVFDFDNTEKTALLTRITGAPFRAVLNITGRKLRFPWCYTRCENVSQEFRGNNHITAYNNCLLRTIDARAHEVPLQLQPLAEDRAWASSHPAVAALPADRPRLLIHPGSRSAFRVWPPENFAAVCDQLQREGLASVTLIAGPAEQATVNAIRSFMVTPVTVIDEQIPIARLAALFQCFQLFLCHDSGPMHLASSVGLPVVALFSSQNINEWQPLGTSNIALQPPLPCVNCVAPGVCKPHDSYNNYCVRNITTERVLTALRERLSRA